MPVFKNLDNWIEKYPELKPVIEKRPTLWLNQGRKSMKEPFNLPLGKADMEEGRNFMDKYAPVIAKIFPETLSISGHLFSPLREIERFKQLRNHSDLNKISGRFFLKCDSELPVAGSIKARGGFFEVLRFANKLAVQEGFAENNRAADLNKPGLKALFSKYTIGVGSTGNLGLSIGIISAKLGFHVNVYMSHDAKVWKKDLLRKNGAHVIEEPGDFSLAVTKGRRETHSNPYGYFVDDENSSQLFLGYSLAAYEIQKQLQDLKINIDKQNPLFIYSPCGVGGSPGGVLFGLKMIYGDAVHSFFAEPTHSPCVLIGLITGKKEKVTVHDFGLDNRTEADGLAVGRPSALASGIIKRLVSGIYTIEDSVLFQLLKELNESEQIFIEPSATAGLI
ncbi:MAG: D-serine ammonia-lyase, partial [Chitinophagaceae bacterium]